jgi:hypothetical protein
VVVVVYSGPSADSTEYNTSQTPIVPWNAMLRLSFDPDVGQWYISFDVPSAIVLKRTCLQRKRDMGFVEYSSSRPAFVQTAPSQTTANSRH